MGTLHRANCCTRTRQYASREPMVNETPYGSTISRRERCGVVLAPPRGRGQGAKETTVAGYVAMTKHRRISGVSANHDHR